MIACGQGKLLVSPWADIQGQFKMTSLKEEMPEVHLGTRKQKQRTKQSVVKTFYHIYTPIQVSKTIAIIRQQF